jgi:hypothetical protein
MERVARSVFGTRAQIAREAAKPLPVSDLRTCHLHSTFISLQTRSTLLRTSAAAFC